MDIIKDFYELADVYCRFVTEKEIAIADIPVLMELLMKLYMSAVSLPEIAPESIDLSPSNDADVMQAVFEEQIPTFYWEVFNPFESDDPVCFNLAEDLSDIAADLQLGMREFEVGKTGNAIFEWKFGLNNHWGDHVVNALRALHAIRIH